MKLLYKTTRDYLIASISILVITGIALFTLLRKEVGDEMNEQLALQADKIFENAHSGNFINAPFIKIEKVSGRTSPGQTYGDSLLYDRVQKKMEEYHYIREVQDIGQARYQATVMTSHIGWDQYYLSIFYIFVLMAILLTGSGVLINYLSNRKVWGPFFGNLKKIKAFSVSSPDSLGLLETPITEFKELNSTLKDLTDRSRKEYLALREFTENASHEIQTPLSIIQSKLDRMSQMEMNEEMSGYIVQAKSGVERLSKMNKSLLLLAKLDNNVFKDQEQVMVDEIVFTQLRNMEDLWANKQITLKENLSKEPVFCNKYLIETLVSNLLSNALKYTLKNGTVEVVVKDNSLTISNTGTKPEFSEEQIFQRFTKNATNITSTGLGLAICKEICTLNKWDMAYHYENGIHFFQVTFPVK